MSRENPYSRLIELMRDEGTHFNPPSIRLAEIKSVEPLLINIGSVDIDKDNLLISDRLLKEYKRDVVLTTSTNSYTGELSYKDVGLNVGDIVLLLPVNNEQDFVLIDKVVRI